MNLTKHLSVSLFASALIFTEQTLPADEKTWTGAIDASWLTGGNWSPDALATDLDSVLFDNSSTANLTQTLDQNWNILGLRITSAPGAITILPGAGNFVLTNTSIDMSAADVDLTILADYRPANNSATINVAAGRTLTLSNSIANNNSGLIGGAGTVRITGAANRMNDQVNAVTFILDGGTIIGNPPVRLAADSGSTVTVIVTNNGACNITSGNGTRIHLGNTANANSTNHFIVDGGSVTVTGASGNSANGFFVGSADTTVGILDINDGTIDMSDRSAQNQYSVLRFGNGVGALGIVNLNANGRLRTPRIDRINGYGIFNFNGGYLETTTARDDYFFDVDEVNLLAGGGVIDTGSRVVAVTASFAGVGGLTKLGAGTLNMLGTNQTYAGPTIISNGTFSVTLPMYSSSLYLESNAVLNVTVAASPGASWSPAEITLQASNTITFSYSPDSQPSSTLLNTTTLTANTTNVINILGTGWPEGTTHLIDYSGSINGGGRFVLGSLPIGLNARLTNNTSTTSIDLIVSGGVNNLDWYGFNGSGSFGGLWDVATTLNWNDGADVYNEYGTTNVLGDSVRFTSTGNLTVELATNVRPSSVLISNLNTGAYSFVGPGKISGPTSVIKQGNNATSTVGFGNTNDYTGGTFLQIGILRLDAPNALPTAGILYLGSLGNGATFQLNGNPQTIGGLVSTGSGGGSRRVVNGAGTPTTLTFNVAANQTNIYAHTMGNPSLAGDAFDNLFSIVKTGPGIQTIGNAGYGGTTTISGGTFLFNGTATAVTNTITAESGGTVGGNGTGASAVGGMVVVLPGGRLEPGNLGVGTFTVSNSVTLQGEAFMQISRPNGDLLVANSISLGGTLTVTNIGGALQAGDSFTLFGGALSGEFTNIALPELSAGLLWNTNNLSVDGTLSVVALPKPSFVAPLISSGNLILSGTDGPANGTYYLLTSTNVADSISTWIPVATNVFDESGAFSFTNVLDPATPQQFFLIQVP